MDIGNIIELSIKTAKNREMLWSVLINQIKTHSLLEVGVLRGEFSAYLLRKCSNIKKYFMIDPWKNLSDWNKPSNFNNKAFNLIYNEMLTNTEFAEKKRVIMQGKTLEVIHKIKDKSLDFIYIDGDHTLRGITSDLISTWDKLKKGGLIGGDDFTPSIWQHDYTYEPTLVFPYAVYFAEAVGAKIYALPYNQFLIYKSNSKFEFIDLTEKYNDLELRNQVISINNNPMK